MAIANKTGLDTSVKIKNNNQKLPPLINLPNKTMRQEKSSNIGGLNFVDKNFKQTSHNKNLNLNLAFNQN
jgi:hypothetical protein